MENQVTLPDNVVFMSADLTRSQLDRLVSGKDDFSTWVNNETFYYGTSVKFLGQVHVHVGATRKGWAVKLTGVAEVGHSVESMRGMFTSLTSVHKHTGASVDSFVWELIPDHSPAMKLILESPTVRRMYDLFLQDQPFESAVDTIDCKVEFEMGER